MKTFIFCTNDGRCDCFEIEAASPAEAVRLLVERHGKRAYSILNVVSK